MHRMAVGMTLVAAVGMLLVGTPQMARAHPDSCVTHEHIVWWRFWRVRETWEITSRLPSGGPRFFTVWPGGYDGGMAPRHCW